VIPRIHPREITNQGVVWIPMPYRYIREMPAKRTRRVDFFLFAAVSGYILRWNISKAQ